MAIGLALMFGFHFPENFDQPYRSASVTEFWRRWHMTLSRFLRDYVYIPLGGNRKGNLRTYVNLVLVFFICGLWHGAAWTFVAWGLYQGALLIAERLAKNGFDLEPRGIPGVALTFLLTCFGWVLFRSETMAGAGHFMATMLGRAPLAAPGVLAPTLASFGDPLLLALLAAAAFFSFVPADLLTRRPLGQGRAAFVAHSVAALALLVAGSAYAMSNSYKPFIYFRF
jgi:alginate O-acetyltransferase complex protein AlgI